MIKRATIARQERRVSKRWVSRMKIRCRLKRATEEGTWIANVRDISAAGIGLTVNRPVNPGMSLTLELPTQAGQVSKQVLVQVRHARAMPTVKGQPRWWALGGTFSRPLTHDEIEYLRNRAPAILVQSERRTNVRHTTRLKSPCPVVRIAEEGPWFATIRNVSETGLCLIVNRPFKPGTLVTVDLPDRRGNFAFPRLFQVVHVRGQAGGGWWVLGGKLLSPLSAAEIREML